MDFIQDILVSMSEFIEPHLQFVAVAISVSLLIIFGGGLNLFIKSKLAGANRVLRVLAFTGVCIFLYGFLLKISTWVLTELLEQFNDYFLSPIVIIVFLTLGHFAEKHNR